MGNTPEDRRVAAWLAGHTETGTLQVEAELEYGERRRTFVVDELLDAGFEGFELSDLAMRLTGLTSAGTQALIEQRAELGADGSADSEVSPRDRSLAQNEIRFREVNERLAAGEAPSVQQLDLVCECSDRACVKVFTIPASEYEWLRQSPWRFAVMPGHEAPAVENVVERHRGFVIVEKHAMTHLQVETADPRR
jgi:hypothetical protein